MLISCPLFLSSSSSLPLHLFLPTDSPLSSPYHYTAPLSSSPLNLPDSYFTPISPSPLFSLNLSLLPPPLSSSNRLSPPLCSAQPSSPPRLPPCLFLSSLLLCSTSPLYLPSPILTFLLSPLTALPLPYFLLTTTVSPRLRSSQLFSRLISPPFVSSSSLDN